ncbi:MAG: ATP-binding cassette domain-containing protein [Clostridia bacterium]|nr:ATP-binding cassette domain-containing protein [Clostridia bacterium]
MQAVIKTENLTKKFGDKLAVDSLNLTVNRGDIYGFIGRNGAGKTTAMKLILNLLTPTEGRVTLFGQTPDQVTLKKVGSLIESPALYGGATAYENLYRVSLLTGGTKDEIMSILEFVGLGDVKNKKVKQFSLGMKQRLGIAVALMGNPELLILDEPINGLDPKGIKEIRELILKINREKNVTFLISSHVLSELEKIATTYALIENGRLIEEISAEKLEKLLEKNVFAVVDDVQKAKRIIEEQFGVTVRIDTERSAVIAAQSADKIDAVCKALVLGGVAVKELKPEGIDFEQYFLTRTGVEK